MVFDFQLISCVFGSTLRDIPTRRCGKMVDLNWGRNQRPSQRMTAWHFPDLTRYPALSPQCAGGLNRSTQHFILEGKDGVWDGTEIS